MGRYDFDIFFLIKARTDTARRVPTEHKKQVIQMTCFFVCTGNDIVFRAVSRRVPSAQKSLTTVFGMGTGVPLRYSHQLIEFLVVSYQCSEETF